MPTAVAARYAVINKPAAVLFAPGPQPRPKLACDDNGNVSEAALLREERERMGQTTPTRDLNAEYAAAVSNYEGAVAAEAKALAEERERQEQRKAALVQEQEQRQLNEKGRA